MFLDCYYYEPNVRGDPDIDGFIKSIETNLLQSGTFIMLSTYPDTYSREIANCRDLNNTSPHAHGKLTYCLIRGLEGSASSKEDGIITLDDIRSYVFNARA